MVYADYENLLEKYGHAVPRYTSYPTAPHFKADFPLSYHSYLLSGLAEDKCVSLYLHIPFCRQLCHYCGCFTKIINHDEPLKEYLKLLREEIRLIGTACNSKIPVNHVHFGGGSPNMLAPDDFKILMETIRRYFSLRDDAEIAMEVDPRLMGDEKVKAYTAAGVNRVSLGVQDFQPDVQRAINRMQPYGMIENCLGKLRQAGIESVNFDLIYGLPLQTEEGIADNIRKTLALKPDRIALFGYAHVPWMKPHQKLLDKYPMPDMAERYRQQERARTGIIEGGYSVIGMDHFALPDDDLCRIYESGKLNRNFQGYTTDSADVLIGLGLSSISSFPQAYAQNTADIVSYRKAIKDGRAPVIKGYVLADQDCLRRGIIQSLMCYFEVDVVKVCREYDVPLSDLEQEFSALRALQDDGLVKIDGYHIKVTDIGRPFVRVIGACFDEHFKTNTNGARHAKAV